MTIFGVPWDELRLEYVEAFLAAAGGESLTWEAKGTVLPHRDSIAKHACGFANSVEGGYLLLGVERDGDDWRATGLDFPNDDPPAWVSGITGTLRPRPRVDVRDWDAAGKRVAVARVEPVAETPCITRGGQVFERVSGATVPVTDPTELARLFERGAAAAVRARGDAEEAVAERLRDDENFVRRASFIFTLGLAAVGYSPDLERRLFSEAAKAHLVDVFRANLRPDRHDYFGGGPRTRPRLDGILALMSRQESDVKWSVSLSRSGAVAVTASSNRAADDPLGIDVFFQDVVRPAWRVAADLVEILGGFGRTVAVVATRGQMMIVHREGAGELRATDVEEWTATPAPVDADVDHVRRQLLRAAGFEAWEPSED